MTQRSRPLRVLALTGHPLEAAGARYRIIQYLPLLRARGIDVEHHAFFDAEAFRILYTKGQRSEKIRGLLRGTLNRARWLARGREFDVIWIHHWLHPFTFPPFDIALRRLGVPVIYDFDDAYYAAVGTLGDYLRDPEWTVRLMRTAHTVVAGSDFIREFVEKHNPRVVVMPTAIDTDLFAPRDFSHEAHQRPVIGWVGSHSTAVHLDPIYPVLQRLARKYDFTLRIIGAGKEVPLEGVNVEWKPWKLENEISNFRDLDIGLYPLTDSVLARGKHGFKLFQYMAVGVPTVASAIGANPSIIRHGENAFLATTEDDWYAALSALLESEPLRRRVGLASRAYVEAHSSLKVCCEETVKIFEQAAARG